MDEEYDFAEPGPAQGRPGRGRGRNGNRGGTNGNRGRRVGRGRGAPNDNQYALMQHHGQGFRRQERTQGPGQRNYIRQDENMRRHDPQPNRNENTENKQKRARFIGFKALEEMAQADKDEIIAKFSRNKVSFFELIERINSEDNADLFVLIMTILSKVCQSSFDELKLQLLLEICNSCYIGKLRNYLMDLPYATVKVKNRLYWNNQQEFWANFVTFSESIISLSPSTALNKCRSLIDGTSKCCLEGLSERHEFTLPEEYSVKLAELRERLTFTEKEEKITKRPDYKLDLKENDENNEPPECFRELSVVPRREDLMNKQPYLRSNIVNGGYRDVEHYLDVQFRLLREDCLGPLRDGISQFLDDPNKKKYDNIRVFRNVKFVMPYISTSKIGSLVQLDGNTTKRMKRINLAHSKRFIFGSLLLFTKDNCKTFITATILDREPKLLANGQLPISIIDMDVTNNLYNGDSYIMIESEVYFEPYYHVLKALQDRNFPKHIAMSKYIINLDPEPKPPAYLQPESEYSVTTENEIETTFRVLDELTWPTKEDLGLNASQYEAYKLALTHEFAIIQGPPGTGKTYLGVKVAKTLLDQDCLLKIELIELVYGSIRRTFAGPMLVICYTNHALDQFLEAILPVTESIVRIGGQSRNEKMNLINLSQFRRRRNFRGETNSLFYEQKHNLKRSVSELQQAQDRIVSLGKEVISYKNIADFVPESRVLGRYYASQRAYVKSDPLEHWLFEQMEYIEDFELEEFEDQTFEETNRNVDDDNNNGRFELDLDEFEENKDDIDQDQKIDVSFSVQGTEDKLKFLVLLYKKATHQKQIEELQLEIVDMKSRLFLFNTMVVNKRETRLHINDRMDLSRISMLERWALYFRWANVVTDHIKTRIKPLQESLESANTAYEEARMVVDLEILRGTKVIGMTTTGAARLRKLLHALAPSIVIVEEAAEVLEQHIVTSLTKNCQHLILIGDHQQLRPSASYMKMARHYNIEVSLFERMITNGIHSRRLDVQHRMRPEIAALISPHIYEHLENHPSVQNFPNVRGISDNLFFFTHDHEEEQVDDSSSRSNKFEADMTLRLANYFMQQGYKPEDITILTAYSGQMFYMKKERGNFALLEKVKITVVDNYQGEESKIILLSLVRNNKDNKIGFLGTENRVCVALSRAREGFYMFGNIDILKRNSSLWTKIDETLQNNASLGTAIMLKCENHSNQITTMSTPEDFNKVPEGGCLAKCDFNLPCGHKCPLVCHGYDRGHVKTRCFQKCEREICELGHPCPFICADKCKPCVQLVPKTLPCGHVMSVHCHKDPGDKTIICTTKITVTLPNCKHVVEKPCYVDVARARCPVRCENRVDKCGHECRLTCHVTEDPEHEMYLCYKPCAKAKSGCTANLDGDRGDHQCPKKCHEVCDDCTVEVNKKRSKCKHSQKVPCKENVDDIPCRKNCARMLECGHFCKKKCFEKCGDCIQKVTKVIPDCNHKIAVICMNPATRQLCRRKCERIMSCGHRCPDRCDKMCDTGKCEELIEVKFDSLCGHKVMLPCKVFSLKTAGVPLDSSVMLKYCQEPCNQTLDCNHICRGTCSGCYQGRLHASCAETCHQTIICGHQCKEACNQVCPPCVMPCEIKCPHTNCNKLCGAPCVPCQEKCKRACKHGACTKRCGEPCDWPPCNESCDQALACGHPCRGLCGEPCPDICKTCHPDDNRLIDFLGNDFEDDAKFIQLQDCRHALELDDMDNLMTGDMETIKIRQCPFCRKPIINTYRYKDLVNKMFKQEINPIKERVHGTTAQIKKGKEELFNKLGAFVKEHEKLLGNTYLSKAFVQLRSVVKTQKKVTLYKLKMQCQYLNILDMICECYQKYKAANLTELNDEFNNLLKIICRVLSANTHKISRQLQIDIGNEIKRMNSTIQLSQILCHSSYKGTKEAAEVVKAVENAKDYILTWHVFEEDKAINALEQLQNAVKVSGIVSKQERDLIVQIIGSKAGSWYKCPNGHFYSIADCGGATVISKCADCGVPIGGTGHRLLSTNAHAGEIDGSRHAAW